MRRVLISDFGAVVRLGLREVLLEAGIDVFDVVPEPDGSLIDQISDRHPDVVLIDLGLPGRSEDALLISEQFPSVKVIAITDDGSTMKVYPPFHAGESYSTALSPDQLVAASSA